MLGSLSSSNDDASVAAYLGKDERDAASDGLGSVEDSLFRQEQHLTT